MRCLVPVIYTRRCEYAIRALTYLAQHPDEEFVRLSEVAEARDLPLPFARKICREMVRLDLLRSARGPTGGYALARPPSRISLLEIREAVDGSDDLESCAVGLDPCTDATPCSLHDSWKPLREKLKRYLERTTLEDLARGRDVKRTRMADRTAESGDVRAGAASDG